MHADEILFLEAGQIVGRSSHEGAAGAGRALSPCSICRWAWRGRTLLPDHTAPSTAPAPPGGAAQTRREARGTSKPLNRGGEEIFGAVVDRRVLRRFVAFLRPYRATLFASVIAVLVFTLTQIAVPLVIRHIIDKALPAGAAGGRLEAEWILGMAVAVFFAVVLVHYVSNYCQQAWVAVTAERVLTDLKRAMYSHLQHVSLSFMDRTQVGQLMSRLQGDVGSLQEFLESSIFAIGDVALLVGIIAVLLALDLKLGLLTLSVVPILLVVRAIWLPAAKRAFVRARETSSIVNSALAENINGVPGPGDDARRIYFAAFREKAADNYRSHVKATRLAQIMVPTVDTSPAPPWPSSCCRWQPGPRSIEVGTVVAFSFYVQRFFDPIRSLDATA
jgi:ATP-binding cassette subfamily B protein